MKYILIYIYGVFLTPFITCFGQTDMLSTQYFLNQSTTNPAFVSTGNEIQTGLLYRSQWSGLQPGLRAGTFFLHKPIDFNSGGIGVNIQSSSYTAFRSNRIILQYAYRLKIGQGHLSSGLSAGVKQFNFNPEDLTIIDNDDPILYDAELLRSGLLPDLDFGVFYEHNKYQVGLSVNHLIKNSVISIESFNNSITQSQVFYFYGAFKQAFRNDWEALPSFQLRHSTNGTTQLDIAALLKYDKTIWMGTSYRSNTNVSFITGIHLGRLLDRSYQKIKIGYSYDFYFNKNLSATGATHELVITYDFHKHESIENIKKKAGNVSPTFF